MALSTRVWGAGRFILLGAGLLAAYVVSFGIAMRLAVRSRDVAVPDVVGRTVNAASRSLGEIGLPLKVEETPRRDPNFPAGVIVAQEPTAGTATRPPRSVRVWVSAGGRAQALPSLIGAPERTAALRVEGEGLKLLSVAEVRTADYPVGSVIAQAPGPGQRSDAVALLVNQGEHGRSYVMPDLIGTVASSAAEALRARGFRVAVVSSYQYPGIPTGIVLRQAPQGGYQIAPGDAISLEVSQ
ncbi:MAG: PASTA domain-containing protein [Luteitalea sp.]|nr:PASTA domain-containing protein [Luteitalea sp.]